MKKSILEVLATMLLIVALICTTILFVAAYSEKSSELDKDARMQLWMRHIR